jgi:metal-responsive CopG/Arc/MetJ family transcriptional regulator
MKQNKQISVRLPQDLLELVFQRFNPRGFLTMSQTIRQALLECLPPEEPVLPIRK